MRPLFGWSARRWLVTEGAISGVFLGFAVDGWWIVGLPVFAFIHATAVVAYADARELEAVAREQVP